MEKWSFCNKESIDHDISKKIKAIETASYTDTFKVNKFDMDTNKHVSNIRYLQWVIDSIPEEITNNNFLHVIDGRFINEVQYGDEITSLTEKHTLDNSFVHTIKTGNNKICASAITTWKAK